MNSSRRQVGRITDTVGVLAVIVAMMMGLLPGIGGLPYAEADDVKFSFSSFEIDGNTTGAQDFDHFPLSEKAADGIGNTDPSWFTPSTRESDYGSWTFKSGGNTSKADLIRNWVQTQTGGPGENWVALAVTRDSDNGNAQITAEFNKSELSNYAGSFRSDGDFYIRFNFPGNVKGGVTPAEAVEQIDARYAIWDAAAQAFGPEQFLNGGTEPAVRAAIAALDGGDGLTFIELVIDLEVIFSNGELDECTTFGSAGFRTEATGANDNNDNTTLKDVVLPFPIDLSNCSPVSVQKQDADGEPLSGVEFTLYTDIDGTLGTAVPVTQDGVTTNPCVTDADGACSFGVFAPGATYWIDETDLPEGYRKDEDLPERFVVAEDGNTLTYTNPRVPYTIDVRPDATNALDDTAPAASEHPFTVELTSDGTGLVGETVTLDWTGIGDIVRINGVDGSGTSCTTQAGGTCTVVVNTTDPGSGTLTASWNTPYQNTVSSPDPLPVTTADGDGTIAYPTIADDATKNWVGLDAKIEDTATNLLGDPHDFEITVWEVDGVGADDGTESGSLVAGAAVQVSWVGPDGSTIDLDASSASCETGALGTCTVTVDSDTNGGKGTATVTSVSGIVAGGESATTTFAAGERFAEKTWRIYKASILTDSVNPAGQSHTFDVSVEYSDDNGDTWANPGSGITVDWDDPDDVDDLAESTCDNGTDGNGTCTIVVFSDAPGESTITVTAVNGDLLLDGGTTADGPTDVPDVSATKTWLAFAVDIDAPAVNLVGDPHVFKVEVNYSDGGAYEAVPIGTKVTWTDRTDPRVTGDTCSTGTGDDPVTPTTETNICFITVTSDSPGNIEITVTGVDDFQFSGPARTEDVDFNTPGETDKTWIDYRASISPDGVNLLGVEHEMTVFAEQDSGNGWEPVPAGTTVTVTSGGVGTIDTLTCDTVGTTGECVVTVDSDVDPGDRTVTVATVQADDVDGDPIVPVTDATKLEQDQSLSATKTWIDYSATISGDATNLTGQQHVFRIEAFQDAGAGDVAVPTGTIVGVDVADLTNLVTDGCAAGTGDDPSTPNTETNVCFVTVTSDDVDAVDVTVDTVQAVDVDPVDDQVQVDDVADQTSTKTWIEVLVTIEDDEINVVGEPHTFTVDVDVITPDGVFEPSSGTLVATTSGVGIEDGQTCDDGLDADGKCTVTVSSPAPGDRVVTAETLTFTYDGTTFTDVDLDGAVGVSSSSDLTETKTWRDYRVNVAADGLNLVRDAHTFTVTIEQTDDGSSWVDVPAGTTATVAFGPTGSITGGTCETSGTTAGDCTVIVSSDGAGTGTLTVSAISVDLPEEGRTDIPVTVTADEDNDTTETKTWIAFRGLISANSVNLTGDPHDFTLTAQYTTNGSTWTDVPDGSAIAYSDGGVGQTTGDTCAGTVGGDCTVTVDSDDSGVRTVTVTGVDPAAITVLVGGTSVERNFGLVDIDDATASGVQPGTDVTVSATKTWASYTLQLTPAEAVNLLDGTVDDPEQDHVITAILTSDDAVNAPVGGQDVMVTLTGDTGLITAVENLGSIDSDGLGAICKTASDGTCDITISSSSSGTAVLSGSYSAEVGDSEALTIESNDAEKVWTTFRVTVRSDAINVVGNPHTFTVAVEQSNPAGDCDGDWCAVEDAVPTIEVTGDAEITANGCADNGTAADGTCTVTIVSSTVETVTLTATYDASVGQTTASFTDDGEKTWVDFAIDVDPSNDENLVDTDHVFTVTVTTTFPVEGGTTTAPVESAIPTISLAGNGTITDNGCAAGTDAAGQCEVTVTSGAPGDSKLTASYLGTTADDQVGKTVVASGDKLWVDYLLVIDDDATNVVGDAHTFTAKLTVDTGDGFGPAAGETLQFSVDGVGGATGGDVDLGDLTCTTGAAGTCTIVINSDEAGTTTVGVSYEAEVGATSRTDSDEAVKQWVDIELVKTAVTGDGFADGDLIADPTAFPFLFFTSSDTGPKTAVYEYEISNPSNVTLVDVVLVDDRLGTIDLSLFPACQVLDPGETCFARSSEQFDYDDATATFGAPITNVGVVTATGNGEEVTDVDDATIGLVAVQSSILIDLVKEVVDGAGDVTVVDGLPIVSWSEEEYNAGVSKDVTYRFTVTNISNSPIIDVELIDPMISDQPIIAKSDGVTLAPNESITVEVDYVLTVAQAFPDGELPSKIDNVASVSGSNETRDSFSQDTDDASVYSELVFAKVIPKTGFGAAGLVPVSMLLVSLGVAILWLERRRSFGR